MMPNWSRDRVAEEVTTFLWEQWTQLGLAGVSPRRDRWAIDPEALLLLGLRIAGADPRLFGETLDWLRCNGRLISAKRLRNLARDAESRRLADAALAWAGMHEPALQLWARGVPRPASRDELIPLADLSVREPDPAFASFGLSWQKTEPSRKSAAADVLRPVALAFRLRLLFGVGARAEVVRYLLTTDRPESSVAEVAHAAGFGKRNVADALRALASAGVVWWISRGNEHRFAIDATRWIGFLQVDADELPRAVDWVGLLPVVWRIMRWFDEDAATERSPYLRASEARLVMVEIGPELAAGGIAVPDGRDAHGEAYWPVFENVLEAVFAFLNPTA
jgi:hypothetical protein